MNQQLKPIRITVNLDDETFRRFAVFDTFTRQKRWRAPALFAGIMLSFAIICFCLVNKKGSVLLGSVLAVLGISLPTVYITMFFSSIKTKAAELHLPKHVYDLTLSDQREGVHIHSLSKLDQEISLPWDKLYAVYRDKSCVYLYVLPSRAFLLPDEQATVAPNKLWSYLVSKVGESKCVEIKQKHTVRDNERERII